MCKVCLPFHKKYVLAVALSHPAWSCKEPIGVNYIKETLKERIFCVETRTFLNGKTRECGNAL